MSDAAPPPWVRRLDIPSGEWRCLVGLCGFAPYNAAGSFDVWPTRGTLAESAQTARGHPSRRPDDRSDPSDDRGRRRPQ
jgi:hypothetical protein